MPEDASRLTSRKAAALDPHVAAYLATGGFPEAQRLQPAERRRLLQGYVDVLLLRDVIERHSVANPTALRWMVRRLLGGPAGLFSVTKFSTDLKSQGIAAGRETLSTNCSTIWRMHSFCMRCRWRPTPRSAAR